MWRCSLLIKRTVVSNRETHLTLTIRTSSEQSQLYPLLNAFASNRLIPPVQSDRCIETLQSNPKIKNIIVEVPSIPLDELERLLEKVSGIDHVEWIYVLGKPPNNRDERNTFLNRFSQVCIFSSDEQEIAVKWILDTINNYRLLGNQLSQSGDKASARKYFQRGLDLYNSLEKFFETGQADCASTNV